MPRRGDGDGDGSLDRAAIGRLLDPFTGGFASALPETVVLLRMALRTIRLFAAGEADAGSRVRDRWRPSRRGGVRGLR